MQIAICAATKNQPEKKFGGCQIFYLGEFSAGRIFFRRILDGSKFFGDGGQIRRLRVYYKLQVTRLNNDRLRYYLFYMHRVLYAISYQKKTSCQTKFSTSHIRIYTFTPNVQHQQKWRQSPTLIIK